MGQEEVRRWQQWAVQARKVFCFLGNVHLHLSTRPASGEIRLMGCRVVHECMQSYEMMNMQNLFVKMNMTAPLITRSLSRFHQSIARTLGNVHCGLT
jgi:hypothetical protein